MPMELAARSTRIKRPGLLGVLALVSAAAVIGACLSLVTLADAVTPPGAKSSAIVSDKNVRDS